jgi:peptidoglycan/LPS O-acetylase OafA/YrhL
MLGNLAYGIPDHATDGALKSRQSRHAGLDLLRLLAMGIVVMQHGLTAVGHYDWTLMTQSGVSIGQFGVAIFCAVAGWFALADRDPPGRWLMARVAKIYPAYWLATLFAFVLALAIGRPVTAWLFVSQMAGTGFFTHGWDLVNVVSWFISLILLCYVLAAVGRFSANPAGVMAIIGGIAVVLVAFQLEISLSRHIIVFAAAAAIRAGGRPRLLLGVAILMIPLLAVQPSFVYAIVALPALWVFRERVNIDSAFVTILAGYVYEFFLLHGIFLAGAAALTASAPLAIALGIGCAMPAAVLLKHTVIWLSSTLRSLEFVN